MPKLLIPLYAIDIQPSTTTLSPTPPDTYEIGKAMDTDTRNHSLLNNDGGEIVSTYTALGSMHSEIISTYGSDRLFGMYLRLASNAYLFDGGDRLNYFQYSSKASIENSWDPHSDHNVYGDGDADTDSEKVYVTSANPKITYTGDGELVITTEFNVARNFHRLVMDCDLDYEYRDTDYKLRFYMDGLLVTLPPVSPSHSWEEEYTGAFVKYTPTGKALPFGFKSKNQRRGRRMQTAMFNEISDEQRDRLYACFIACKGLIPVLFMRDETNNSTWAISKIISFTEREPNPGVWFVEMEFEEY